MLAVILNGRVTISKFSLLPHHHVQSFFLALKDFARQNTLRFGSPANRALLKISFILLLH